MRVTASQVANSCFRLDSKAWGTSTIATRSPRGARGNDGANKCRCGGCGAAQTNIRSPFTGTKAAPDGFLFISQLQLKDAWNNNSSIVESMTPWQMLWSCHSCMDMHCEASKLAEVFARPLCSARMQRSAIWVEPCNLVRDYGALHICFSFPSNELVQLGALWALAHIWKTESGLRSFPVGLFCPFAHWVVLFCFQLPMHVFSTSEYILCSTHLHGSFSPSYLLRDTCYSVLGTADVK